MKSTLWIFKEDDVIWSNNAHIETYENKKINGSPDELLSEINKFSISGLLVVRGMNPYAMEFKDGYMIDFIDLMKDE